MGSSPPRGRTACDGGHSHDGWSGLLLGRDTEVHLRQPGRGRFTKLGLPFPVFTANFVGGLEIVGGLLLILGLGTRLITIPFIIEMLVAILSTKPRLFLGTLPLPPPPVPPQVGIWAVLHEVRSEYAQIMSCLFLLISGPGPWSLDTSLLCGEQGKRDGTGRFCVYTPDPISPVSWRL